MLEAIIVGTARLITVASLPVLAWECLTMETRDTSIWHIVALVAVVMAAIAITVRAEICEQERARRSRR